MPSPGDAAAHHETNAILPAIAGNEIAARIANRGSAVFLDQFDDVLAETVFIGFGVAGS